jgi:uncharacterized protein DUF4432
MTPAETIRLESGDLAVDVLPERGLDLGVAALQGERFSWTSKLGHVAWQGDFFESFGGGLMFTCGLRNVGVPSEGQPQHGLYTAQTASEVDASGDHATGRVVDAMLELRREIRVEPDRVTVKDVVRNTGPQTEAAPLLYHVNLVWDGVEIDSREVVPRDDDARAGDWRSLGAPGPERVYEHLRATGAIVTSGSVRVTITSDQPRLWQWIEPALGVLGIEPANCSVLGRAHDRAEGRLPVLAPGEARGSSVEIRVEAG